MSRPARRRRLGLLAGLAAILLLVPAPVMSLAVFSDSDTSRANVNAATHWPWFLHDDWDGDANQNEYLPMDRTAPTHGALVDLGENCNPGGPGRALSDNGACAQVQWRTSAAPNWSSAGPIRLRVWLRGTCNITARAGITIVNVFIAFGSVTRSFSSSGWTLRVVDIALGMSTPSGFRVAVRLEGEAGISGCRVAYDTTAYPALVWIP